MEFLSALAFRRADGRRSGWSAGRLLLFGWLLAGTLESPAETGISSEYQIKAVFLFNFAQFVEWPRQAFPEAETPLVIGILGEDPFSSYLDETVRGEKVNQRSLTV